MSQNISVESTSSTNLGINPVLQAALSSLDVQLEEELARYRRQRAGRPLMSPKGLGRNQTHKPIDLMSVRGGNQPQRPALGMSTAPLASFPLFMVQPGPEASPADETHQQKAQPSPMNIASGASPGMVVADQNQADDNLGIQHDTQPLTPPNQSAGRGDFATVGVSQSPPEDYLESSEQLLRSLAEAETVPAPKKHFTEKLLTPLGVGSILLLLLSSATAVYFLSNPSSFAALLDRFFGSKTPTPAQNNIEPKTTSNSGENTPVVNGPDLASDEFVDLNLNTLSHLETSPKPSPSASSVQVPSLPTLPNAGAATTIAPSVVPNTALPRRSADLSSVLLGPNSQAGSAPYAPIPRVAPLPAPATAAPKSSTPKSSKAKAKTSSPASTQLNKLTQSKSSKAKTSSPASTQLNKSTQTKPAAASATSTVKKKPQASPSPAPVAASTVGVPGSYYYVFLNSGGESALEQARTIVPDAYLENFPQGTRIQMGAFPTESEAKTMVEKLQGQGLSASIYHP
ncbi:MAG TPA: SPOR domain-containing protein [Candidatus Sericytochromatia bacterium]